MNISYDIGAAAHWLEPEYCLKLAVLAERTGFRTIWVGDHFLPWFHTGAHSPQAWVWVASAASRTSRMCVGTAATVPMFKYHPAVVGQAFATLESLFPGRIKMIVGTGEAINESPFLDSWPPWSVVIRDVGGSSEPNEEVLDER